MPITVNQIKASISESKGKGIKSGLVGCEFSDSVRSEFEKKGWNMFSCDLLPSSNPLNKKHYQGDVLDLLELGVFHPPCTYLTVSQAWTFNRPDLYPHREQQRADSISFVESIWDCSIPHLCIENPVGFLSTMSKLGKPTQSIQPYNFGEDASKKTCLWLRGLNALTNTQYVAPRLVNGKKRWSNQTDSGQNRLGPSEDRWAKRSETFSGIAKAMADQWTEYLVKILQD